METPKIIFQDDSILILNKPSGWITNSASTTRNQPVVEDWLAENFKFEIFNFKLYRHGIVHRLDKETSGILVIAKTKQAFEELQRQFKERIVEKSYIALVHGEVANKEGEIEATVGRLPWRRDRFGVLPRGREAITKYKVIRYISAEEGKFTLVEFFPKTGRTHQIRIHAKHIGHPLVGDEFYAGRKTARNDRKWCLRLFLHAAKIKFVHPESKERVVFEAPFSSDLKEVLEKLNS